LFVYIQVSIFRGSFRRCLFGVVVFAALSYAQAPVSPVPAELEPDSLGSLPVLEAAGTPADPFGPWEEWDSRDFVRVEARAIPRPNAGLFTGDFTLAFPTAYRWVIHFRKNGNADGELAFQDTAGLYRSSPDAQREPASQVQYFPFTWSGDEAGNRLDQLWAVAAESQQTIASRIGEIQIDGTDYEIRIETPLATQVWKLLDEHVASGVTGRAPVVRWLHQLRFGLDPEP